MPNSTVRIGLLGAGRIGAWHAKSIAFHAPGAELATVADIDGDAAQRVAADCRCDRWTANPAEVFSDAIDAVAIASSTDSHAEFIIAAAEAGKDIFCEKPIALDLESSDSALAAVAASGVKLQLGFQRRYDKGFRKARTMIETGELGRIETIRDTMRDPGPPPKEYIARCGGHFRDMSIHNFDSIRWPMGEEVEEVFAYGSNLIDPVFGEFGDIDTSVVTLKFKSGALGIIDNGRRAGYGYDIRAEVYGSDGAVFIGYSRETPLLHLTEQGVTSDHVTLLFDRFGDAYIEEICDFVSCIFEDRQPAVTGADGRAAMALAYAAEASIREHAPVAMTRFSIGG